MNRLHESCLEKLSVIQEKGNFIIQETENGYSLLRKDGVTDAYIYGHGSVMLPAQIMVSTVFHFRLSLRT